MTDAERRRAFTDGIQRRDIRLCGAGGMDMDYWTERKRGEAARVALEREAERGPYLYGTSEAEAS